MQTLATELSKKAELIVQRYDWNVNRIVQGLMPVVMHTIATRKINDISGEELASSLMAILYIWRQEKLPVRVDDYKPITANGNDQSVISE